MNLRFEPDAPVNASGVAVPAPTFDADVIEELAYTAQRYRVMISVTVTPYADADGEITANDDLHVPGDEDD